jgi:UDP-glucose 4-epimerase
MHYLVTGGAGYVGSHTVRALLEQGHTATILDNFSTGHRWATQGQTVLDADLRNPSALRAALRGLEIDGIFHFAAKSLVGESAKSPVTYYQNNVTGTANLLEIALENGWHRVVFSSTAAIYGNPLTDRITEDHPKVPINVYGQTKLTVENLLQATCEASPLAAVCLRYFNAAGAAEDASLGEDHDPETHLIPNALKAASGAGQPLTIFGDDYPTPDGTCIRDYIHVQDLADAHLRAMNALEQQPLEGPQFNAFNLGNGVGFSVKEVFAACEDIVGQPIPHRMGQRREGDPARLVADATRAREELGWQPRHSEIDKIVATAWAWEQKHSSV